MDTTGSSSSLAGTVNSAGQLVKEGAGSLTLTGINTYEGGTPS
ncbi:MAG: autotransporter-associated beta strand repeat-containing protein [Moraxellaceae bacterium]|nr:autotransporter-associated beta strand repeat-containing protein [Moraxellaceae bacterium]